MQQPEEQQQQQALATTSSFAANKNRPKSGFLTWVLNKSVNNKGHLPPSSAAITTDEIYSSHDRNSLQHNNTFSNDMSYFLHAKLEIPDDGVDDTKSCVNAEYVHKRKSSSFTKSVPCSETTINSIQIPDRCQSHLYTPFHDAEQEEGEGGEPIVLFDYKHKSYYTSQLSPAINAIDVSSSNSTTLTRSATWQPSSSQLLSPLPPPPPVPLHNNVENMIPARRTSRNYSQDPEIQAKLEAVLNSEKATHLSHILNNNNNNNSSSTNMYRRSTTPKYRKL